MSSKPLAHSNQIEFEEDLIEQNELERLEIPL